MEKKTLFEEGATLNLDNLPEEKTDPVKERETTLFDAPKGYQPEQNMFAPSQAVDPSIDPSKFDFHLTYGDNEERRAQNQSLGSRIWGAAVQTGAMAVGGIIEGFGYLGQAFTDTGERLAGESMEFDNLFIRAGKGIQEAAEQFAPVYQTRQAQEGGLKGLSDGSWWASRFPTVASSLSMMIPTFAFTRGLSMLGKGLSTAYTSSKVGQRAGKSIGGTRLSERMSPMISDVYNSRRARNFIDTTGSSVISRHLYSSLESNDLYQQVYERELQRGKGEEEAKQLAGEAAAFNYRMGWMNIWKDMIQWRIVLGNRMSASASTNRSWLPTASDGARTSRLRANLASLESKYGKRIPRKALEKAGITMRDLGKMGLAEGFEEINIQFQKSLAMNHIDQMTGYASGVPSDTKGWINTIKSMASGYQDGFVDFVYDPETIISDEAFDAAFWAFMSGATTGVAFKGINKTMRSSFKDTNVEDNMTREAARMDAIRTNAAAMQKAQAEGDELLASNILDNFILGLTVSGLHEGNTFTPSTVSDGRHSDLIVTLQEIVNLDDAGLEANGLSPDARDFYEFMLAEAQEIQTIYDHHADKISGEGTQYDLALAAKKTEAQWKLKRAKEMHQDYESQLTQIEAETAESLGLEQTYQRLSAIETSLESITRNITREQERRRQTENAPETYLGAKLTKEKNIEDIDAKIENYKQRKQELTQEKKDILSQEDIDSSMVVTATQHGKDQFTKEYISGFVEEAASEIKVWQKNLQWINSPEGQSKYIKAIKDSQQKSQDAIVQAQVDTAQTTSELDSINLDQASKKVKDSLANKRKLIQSRFREAAKTDKTKVEGIDSDIVSNAEQDVASRIFAEEGRQQVNEYFKNEVDTLDLTNEQKANLKDYLNDYINNLEKGNLVEQARQNVLQNKPSLVKQTSSKFIETLLQDNVESATEKIQNSDYSDALKKQLRDFVVEHQTSKRNILSAKQIRDLAVTQKELEIKKGRKKPEKETEAEAVLEDTITLEHTEAEATEVKQETKIEDEGEVIDTLELEPDTSQETKAETEIPIESDKSVTVNAAKPFGKNVSFSPVVRKGNVVTVKSSQSSVVTTNPEVNFTRLADPKLNTGSIVNIVLKDDTGWAKAKEDHRTPDKVPLYIEFNGEYVGMLQSNNKHVTQAQADQRRAIVSALRNGQKVQLKVVGKEINSSNIQNAYKDGKPVMMPINVAMKNQYVVNENGDIELQTLDKGDFILVTTQNIRSIYSPNEPVVTLPEIGYDQLSPEVRGKMEMDIAQTKIEGKKVGKDFEGSVGMVVLNPKGNYSVMWMTTRNLNRNAADRVIEYLESGDIDSAREIVSMDSPEVKGIINGNVNSLYLESFQTENKTILRFFSNSLNKVVEGELSDLLANNHNNMRVLDFDETGAQATPYNDYVSEKINFTKELYHLLTKGGPQGQGKKYQVDRNRVGVKQKYTSRITGNEYDSYQHYLMSENEHSQKDADHTNAILATNNVSLQGQMWSNIGVQFEVQSVGKKTPQETRKEEVIKKVSTPKKKTGFKIPKNPQVEALEKAFTEDSFFKENNISLEQLKDRFKSAKLINPSLSVEQFITSQKDDDANQTKC